MKYIKNAVKKGLTMDEACIYLGGISRPTMYRLMNDGLPTYTIGSRRYFLISVLDTFLERQSEKEGK